MNSESTPQDWQASSTNKDPSGLAETFSVLVKHIRICSRDVLSYGPGIGVQIPFERTKS
jgi:hypothetical protein